ncbi:MAG TPA: peptidyl-tRNA hydrolase, partial [Methanomassiliicoccales archaeon]|nr:peptidyl-tRNA hydrolase [Methanomassiliicoccales archaeon]
MVTRRGFTTGSRQGVSSVPCRVSKLAILASPSLLSSSSIVRRKLPPFINPSTARPLKRIKKRASDASWSLMQKFENKMVIAVRKDLKLSSGKLAAQVAHAAVNCALASKRRKPTWFETWYTEGQ